MTTLVIPSAGLSGRWENYTGVPKHLVDVGGQPLLERTIQQFAGDDWDIITIAHDPRYEFEGATLELVTPPDEDDLHETDKLLCSRPHWSEGRTVVLFGDVWFSDEAAGVIRSAHNEPYVFYGHSKPCKLIKKGWSECFGLSFYQDAHQELEEAMLAVRQDRRERKLKDPAGREARTGGAAKEVYRKLHGIPFDEQDFAGQAWVDIQDGTSDFDMPRDYERWLQWTKSSTTSRG